VAEREAAVLAADEEVARRQILQVVGETWSALQAAPSAIAAAQAAVAANERALADARLRYRAMVEPLTETLLVQRDLQVARASLLTTLTRQAIDRAVLAREIGADPR
jgi:outer membrane protein TolC